MRVLPGDPRRLFRWARALVAGISAVVLLASPVIARILFFNQDDPDAVQPRRELAQFVTTLWHEQMGTRLRIASGSDPYENAIGFYSADHPAIFIAMTSGRAPWINHTLLEREGILYACVHEDKGCAKRVKLYQPPTTRIFHVTLSHTFQGYKNPPVDFDIYLVPPVPVSPRQDLSATIPPRPRPG
jgi:hypothetical protein